MSEQNQLEEKLNGDSVGNGPLSETRLQQITNDACEITFEKTEIYTHSETEGWNSSIVDRILKALISECGPCKTTNKPYKYAVTSTIIQHDPPTSSNNNEKSQSISRRGMHSAAGAYWNNSTDGMWSTKWEGGLTKGMDVVVNIMWFTS